MTIGREQSDFSQGDLVFRGRIRAPTSGRIDHLRHLQDRAEFQRRLDAEEELRKALTRLFPLPGAADGTEGYREKRAFEEFIDWAHARWYVDPTMHIYHYAYSHNRLTRPLELPVFVPIIVPMGGDELIHSDTTTRVSLVGYRYGETP